MGLDIIEIALDHFTDADQFEKLASEVMRDEGYPTIKPLGGVHDLGQDATAEAYFSFNGRHPTIFQYTLQEYLPGKVEDTIAKLQQHGIPFSELVLVTPRAISSERQINLVREVRRKHGITFTIYERKTLVNRLANYENGIFHRYFPDISKQISHLTSKQPNMVHENADPMEPALLRASLAFTFNPKASAARKSMLDYLVLALVANNPDGLTVHQVGNAYQAVIGGREPPKAQLGAALDRLVSQRYLEHKKDSYRAAKLAREALAGSTIYANHSADSLLSDIVDKVCRISGLPLTEEVQRRIVRNSRDVLVQLFRLMGIEMANQVLHNSEPAPVYLEQTEALVSIAKRDLTPRLGELVIAVIAETIRQPTKEQAQTLSSWSLAYLGVTIMNLDPTLNELQATRFARKVFILDTDFVLDCLVQEHPKSAVYRNLVSLLVSLGSTVYVPEPSIDECILHAKISPRTYRYFNSRLLSLPSPLVDEQVWNVFVKGYYYALTLQSIPRTTTFAQYLANYYEPDAPKPFMHDVLRTLLPSQVQVVDPSTLLPTPLPNDEMNVLSSELFNLISRSRKAEYRTEEDCRKLAETDARLFLTTLHLNGEMVSSSGRVLGGSCYVVTSSGKYLRSARRVGLRDVVTTHPQSLIALLELIGRAEITPSEFVGLFENPLLIYAVQQTWDDIRSLLEYGLELQGKSLSRLRWDLDEELHNLISAAAQNRLMSPENQKAAPGLEPSYVELLRSASRRGYKQIPEVEKFLKAMDRAKSQADLKAEELDELSAQYKELEKAIAEFGRRKQKYLRRMSQRKKP